MVERDGLLLRLSVAVTFLVFPGADARKQERALASGADAVVLDLEDGVAAAAKDEARAGLAAFAAADGGPVRLVRVNDPLGPEGERDLRAAADIAEPLAVVVPKAHLDSVERAAQARLPLLALIEDACGLRDAFELAAHPAVFALGLGVADLRAALGLSADPNGLDLLVPRSQLVVASSAAGIRAPVDGPCLAVRDDGALARETRAARDLGLRESSASIPTRSRASAGRSHRPRTRWRTRTASSRSGSRWVRRAGQ